jgi:metal-responsive CopG/Arc/MetJ family transcriptional regulator
MAKVMVSIPDELLARIDEAARARGTSRSGLLQAAAERELARRTPEEMLAAIERARAATVDWPELDAASVIRADRDAR